MRIFEEMWKKRQKTHFLKPKNVTLHEIPLSLDVLGLRVPEVDDEDYPDVVFQVELRGTNSPPSSIYYLVLKGVVEDERPPFRPPPLFPGHPELGPWRRSRLDAEVRPKPGIAGPRVRHDVSSRIQEAEFCAEL